MSEMNSQGFGNIMGTQQQHPPSLQHQPLQHFILDQLHQSHRPQAGKWQATLNAEQRADILWNIFNAIKHAKPDTPDTQALPMAFRYENDRFMKVQSEKSYFGYVKAMLQRLQNMRQQNTQAVQAFMMHPASNVANPQAVMIPQTPCGFNQDKNAFLPPFSSPLQDQLNLSPLPMTQNPSLLGMEDPSFGPQAQEHNIPQQMQRGPPGGVLGNIGFDSTQLINQQASAMGTALVGHDVVPAGNNTNTDNLNGLNPATPVFTMVPEPPQVIPRAPRPRQFQHPPSPSVKEWEWQKREEGAKNETIDQLMALVGLEKVKQQILAIKNKIEIYEKQETDLQKERFNVIFQGNPGTGKTTVARLYAMLLHSIGVLESNYVKETSGSKLASKGVRGTKKMLKKMTNANYGSGGGVLFIDEAYQLVSPHVSGTGRQVLDIILTEMENNLGRLAVIFVGYRDDMEQLFEHNPGLPSRVPYTLHFEDFNDAALWRMLCDKIDAKYSKRMKVEDGLDGLYTHVAIRRLGQGRRSRGFGNARSVENLLAQIAERQATRIKAESRSGGNPDHFFLTKEDLIGPDPTKAKFQSAAWVRLQELIGLDSVKASVRNMIEMIEQNYRRELAEILPLQVSLNQVFVGSPGTGKTTVAKLYSQILADLGLLSKGDVVLKNPSDFIGDCVGRSEAKTRGVLAATAGKVLIIDEAYMLDAGNASASHQDSFKTGVIDTLVAEVQGTLGEDRCIILAGYEDKMQAMFRNSNPGLARRFPTESAFHFEDFNLDQLMQVLALKMHEQDMQATPGALEVARDMLSRTIMRPRFSNGGEVERCLAAAKLNYEARQAKKPVAERAFDTLLQAEDFDPDCGRMAHDGESSCRKMLEGLVDKAIIEKLEECQRVWRGAKQLNCDPRELVSTRFVFKGGPGTGKTTVARSMGKMFYDMGFLATDEVLECPAADLIGQYVGQTAPKAREQLLKSLGKVLFIDEAHHLIGSTFASEALNELVAFLNNSQHAHRLVIVLAGHTSEINALMASAPALSGHFSEEVVFANLEPDACIALLAGELARLGVPCDAAPFLLNRHDEGYVRLASVFEALRKLASWSNARDILALATRIARAHMVAGSRCCPGGEVSSDIVDACAREILRTQTERCVGEDAIAVLRTSQKQPFARIETSMRAPPPVVQTTQAVDGRTADARAADDEGEDECADECPAHDEQELLRQMGKCEAGYMWRRQGSGWRCEGGTHYVSNEQLKAYTK